MRLVRAKVNNLVLWGILFIVIINSISIILLAIK